jgi:hypothetical protein
MRLLRRRSYLRHLALLALAIQFFAAFGHVHADTRLHTPLEARTFFALKSGPCLPGLPDHSDCIVCATIALLGSSTMPQSSPEVGGNLLRFAGVLTGSDTPTLKDSGSASFQARAPPLHILA